MPPYFLSLQLFTCDLRLGRQEAESLLTCSGDFLVRESSASGQYVLSGMQGGSVRHLLLVDGHGQVVLWCVQVHGYRRRRPYI